MPSQEERLEQMLNEMMGKSSGSQETLQDGEALLEMEDMPDIESLLDMSSLQEIENMLNQSGMGSTGIPGVTSMGNAAGDVWGDMGAAGNMPGILTAGENPETMLERMVADLPEDDAAWKMAEEPVVTETPVIPEEPVIAETPVMIEEPSITETPVMEGEPIVSETPVMEEEPVIAETPVIPDESAVSETPVMTEDPIIEETAVMEGAGITETPVIEETPVIPIPEEPAVVTESAMEELAAMEAPDADPLSADLEPDQETASVQELLRNLDQDETDFEEGGAMSEEEIERLLQASREEAAQAADQNAPEDDLMSLLAETTPGDDDLQDIQNLLLKSDNNEAVDESVASLMREDADAAERGEGVPEDVGSAEDAAEENAEMSERQKKALEKKRAKEEKAAAKKAAKEAKKTKKQGKKTDVPPASAESPDGAQPDEAAQNRQPIPENIEADDMSDMDSLLGVAGSEEVENLIREKEIEEPKDPAGQGKKGLFAKILDFLTEEDEDEEETQKGTEDVPLSEENQNILDEMDKEKAGKKGKKGKKAKKGKKGQNPDGGEDADGEEGEAADDKKKKAKKPKKEKVPKEKPEKTPEELKNRITLKKILPVAAACLTVMLAILLLVNLGGDFTVKQAARKAYYQEDYETCYKGLYGKNLNETEQVMFGKSESILCIRLWMREYELFIGEGQRVEALDVLVQAVNDYEALYRYAEQWNAAGEVSAVYSRMLGILQEEYGLTEAQAQAIAAEPDDVEYTKMVTAAAEGKGFAAGGADAVPETVNLPHMLPEEQQFPENNGGR